MAASLQRELAGQTPGAPPPAAAGADAGVHGTPARATPPAGTVLEPAASAAAGAPLAASATKPAAQRQHPRQRQQLCEAPRPASPAGSLWGSPRSSCSEWVHSDSCCSCSSLQGEQEAGRSGSREAAAQQGAPPAAAAAPLPRLQLASLAPAEATAGGASGGVRRPLSSRIPWASQLPPPLVPAASPRACQETDAPCVASTDACSLSPEVLRRLHGIQSKLEAALADQALEVEPQA